MIQHWLDQNNLPYTWLVDQKVFQIDQDKFCVIKEKEDRILDDTFDLILDEEEGELIQEHDCKYLVFQLGEWIFYTLPDKIKLTPLKYLGQSKQAENFPYIGIHGMYEICNGSKNYKEWCKKAKFLGIKTLGICEYNTLAGTLQFQLDCLANEIKPILGITALVKDEKNYTYRIKVYARNEIGWRNILYINKAINVDNEGFIWEKDVFQYLVGTVTVLEQQLEGQVIFNYKNVTGQKTYFKLDPVQWKSDERDKKHLEYIKWVYENIPDKAILVCDSYYLDKQDSRTKTLLNKIGKVNIDNQSDDQYFKSKGEIEQQLITLFNDENRGKQFVQQAFDNLSAFDEVDFRIQTGKFWLPEYKLTEVELMLHQTKDQLFWDLIDQGIYKKIVSKGLDPEPYLLRVEEEYVVLEEGGFIDYFLILSDIVRWCDMKGILIGVGRGSVGGSIVAFLLGLTKTDAIKYDLLFERFLNKGRIGRGLPDADTDVESNRRDEVKRYIEERYGIDNVCSIGTYGTFKTKAALRDLCRISGVPPQTLNYFAAMMEESDNNYESVFKQAVQTKVFKDFVQENYDAVNDIPLILGQPKTVSIHAAGVIITPDVKEGALMTIYNWMPVKKVDGVIVSEWEGPQLETAGFLKEDILGIKQLDKFQDIFKLIKSNNKELPSLDDIDTQDAQVYELFCQGFNQDLFHFGSVGQTQYSQQVKPREIQELIAMIAAYRPGAMEFGAHEDYVKIKMGRKQPEYDYMLKEVTEKTFGLYLYQEQVMKACQVLGGFDLTTADDIRSAMGKKKYDKIIKYKDLFIKGAYERGCGKEEAEKIWSKLEAFAGYGFNRCIDGDEKLYRVGHNYTGLSSWHPTIKEMFKIKNDYAYAKQTNHLSLHGRYKRKGYGAAFSINDQNRLIRNKIKDIRYAGIRDVFEIILQNGKRIRTTDNHKFPTEKGIKLLSQLIVNEDRLFINKGYEQKESVYRFGRDENHNYPSKGQMGFQKKDTSFTRWRDLKKQSEGLDSCQLCNKSHRRLELHHKDGNHGNNNPDNVITLCPSCHKKEEYKLGRIKMGEKGLLTELSTIISIKLIGKKETYDVEMEAPYHTFCTDQGIVTCNSHATSYALTGFFCQYLKVHHPIEFWTVALQYASEEEIPGRINEISRLQNIKILSPDINKSQMVFSSNMQENSIYWSIGSIRNVGEVALQVIMKEREQNGPFFSLEEFVSRIDRRKVNKTCIVNLILSGCFDQIENISLIQQRKKLLRWFFVLIKQPLPEIYDSKQSQKDWFWFLEQKRVSGSGLYDYTKIFDEFGEVDLEHYYCTPDKILLEENVDCKAASVGILNDIIPKKSKKGEFAQLIIENNNALAEVTLWNESWIQYKDLLNQSIGRIIAVDGNIVADRWKKHNIIHSQANTKVEII